MASRTVRGLIAISLLTISASAYSNDIDHSLSPAFDAIEMRDFTGAIDQLSDLAGKNDDPRVLFHLARIQHRTGLYKDAQKTLEDLLDDHPGYTNGHYLSGLVNLSLVGEVNIFRKVGVAKQALADWEKTADLDPGHVDARYAIFSYYVNAPGIAGGDLETAEALLPDLMALSDGYGTMAKGVLHSKKEELEQAEAAFIKASEILDTSGSHFALAQYYLRTEQYQKAIDKLNIVMQKEPGWWDPDITVVQLILARANAEIGNKDTARELATTALANNPNKQVKGLLEETLDEL